MYRRTVLVLGTLGVGGYAAIRYLPALIPSDFDLEELSDPAGFRSIAGGESSSAFNAFIGLPGNEVEASTPLVTEDEVRADICASLFGSDVPSDRVPVASFSDYYCPFCRVQTRALGDMAATNSDGMMVKWHELPLLGETSELAARVALAADLQGQYTAFHEQLIRTPFQPNDAYIEQLASSIGVDFGLLVQDMESETVRRQLETRKILSRIFRFVGTPALVVGRTVVNGQISERQLRDIIELERSSNWRSIC